MSGIPEPMTRPARPPPPMQARGPHPNYRPRPVHVDREKTCPLLLRVFTKVGGHHEAEEFALRGKEPKDEVQIYTWMDATLRELTDLVKEVSAEARRKNAKISFALVYPDRSARYTLRVVGTTFSNPIMKGDDNKTLAELHFQIGDYLSVAII